MPDRYQPTGAPAASPSLDPEGSHLDLGGGFASITSGHAWLDHGFQANALTLFD